MSGNLAEIAAIEKALTPAIVGLGYELVLVELGRAGSQLALRLYIDKPGGVTVGDCETVSKEVGPILDAEDFFSGRYVLEVSSPGLDRPLRRAEDFQRYAGQKVRLELRQPIEGRRRATGVISGIEGGRLKIVLEGGGVFECDLADLRKANLVWEGDAPPKAP